MAEAFNAIPWAMTGILLWICIYFGARMVLSKAWGSAFTPNHAKQILVGALILSTAATVATWDTYDKGFWGARGLGTISDYGELEEMRTQPVDVHVHDTNEFTDNFGWSEDATVPTTAWLDWVIYQPGQEVIIDFFDSNGHQIPADGINSAFESATLTTEDSYSVSDTFTVTEDPVLFPEGHHESVSKITTDISCEHRAEERKINDVKTDSMISSTLSVTNADGNVVADINDCAGTSVDLPVGTYQYQFDVTITGPLALNDTMMKEIKLEIASFQPLLVWNSAAPAALEGKTVNLSSTTDMALGGSNYGQIDNPGYHMNPKSLDAKLIYAMFIPCLTFGAMVFILLRSMARGYEFEMNKCYGCDLCDDACPVRLFNGGDKLNIIYNSWNNEDDGVPMYSCLTCTACTNACPQLVDYDSYVDIRRGLIVGGPQAEIPHTVLQAVLAAEAEEDADQDFITVEDYPIDSNIGYYPGCVDYLDQEMVFSHVNEGEMNLGAATTSAYTLFDELGVDVSYLGRDFLKCCGHDQKWQGLTEVFDKLKAYNQKKIHQSGIDTLVSSCAECFRTFARDYELEDVKVMHTTEFLLEQGFDMDLKVAEETTVTYHDPCRLGRQMGVYEEPRELINAVEGVNLVEMEHSGEDAMCCGVSSMMSCNENARALRVSRMEEIKSTGADTMLTSCPKCVTHFECLKFEDDDKYSDIKILDVVTFLAQQINEKKSKIAEEAITTLETEA
jgi:Fe-S oxidoreductase